MNFTSCTEAIERFGQIMRQKITTGPIPFRKAYIKSVVDRIEVDDHVIRIMGDQATLEQVIAGDQNAGANVRSFVRKWRTRYDSNVLPLPYRAFLFPVAPSGHPLFAAD